MLDRTDSLLNATDFDPCMACCNKVAFVTSDCSNDMCHKYDYCVNYFLSKEGVAVEEKVCYV